MGKKRIGILTAGGDCPGLNACIRGVAKASYELSNTTIIGIHDGFLGLMNGYAKEVSQDNFSGILNVGGTIFGTARTPYSTIKDDGEQIDRMKKTYKKLDLDCLVTLGGNGTHKTANLLCQEGLNVVGLPKTIDNDIFGTDVTFGFHTAVDIATEVIDRLHTTANSHGRIMVTELMGNKAGWLTLYAGVAGGADIILLPEIPYSEAAVMKYIHKRHDAGKAYTIIAIAEGAKTVEEAGMKGRDMRAARTAAGVSSPAARLAEQISALGFQARAVVPGHIQRGGNPSAYDRVLSTQFGAYAARLIDQDNYGRTVALKANQITDNALRDIAGIAKTVPKDHELIRQARDIGVRFGDA